MGPGFPIGTFSGGTMTDDLQRQSRTRSPARSLDDLGDPCPSADLAAALSKSPKTIIDWCQEREYTHLPCFKIGNRWYHRPAEVKRWLRGIQSGQVEFGRRPRSGDRR